MSEEHVYDFAIIGGGIVGAATFYKLQTAFPELKIILLEKEDIKWMSSNYSNKVFEVHHQFEKLKNIYDE